MNSRMGSGQWFPMAGFASAALVGLLAPTFSGCGWSSLGSDEFVAVGIPTDRMVESAAEQIGQNWCWAACIQMVLSVKGVECDQAEVVRKTFGQLADLPGGPQEIVSNLSGWFNGGSRRTLLVASGFAGPPQAGMLYSYLRSRTPVILGVNYPGASIGHAVVVTGAVFRVNEHGLGLEKALVRDPSPEFASTRGKRELTAEEFGNTQMHFFLDVVRQRQNTVAGAFGGLLGTVEIVVLGIIGCIAVLIGIPRARRFLRQ